jgi:Spy/CpxP family protein refolding chaperone
VSARSRLVVALVALLGLCQTAVAQGAQADPATRRGGAGRGRFNQPPAGERVALERQVKQTIARVVRRQLNLNDQQMAQLTRVDQKFEVQKRQLEREERMTRQGLRVAMLDSANADSAKFSQSIAQLIQFQRRRADILEGEQKELSGFLTPRQRAQYLAIQEQVRRRLEQAGRGGPPPVGPPPR